MNKIAEVQKFFREFMVRELSKRKKNFLQSEHSHSAKS